MKRTYIAALAAMALVAAGCSSETKTDASEGGDVKADITEKTVQDVRVVKLEPSAFTHDIVSNGRVRAGEIADLSFRSPDLVSEVLVHNGQRVAKGQPLVRLDLFKLNSEKEKQLNALEQARLELQDVIIGQGYDPANTAAIPAEVMKLARVRSGLAQAEAAYSSIERDIEQATLTAPFAGVVANLKAVAHSMAPTSEPVCRIINDGSMTIEFPIIESELAMVGVGDPVEVTPFNGGDARQGRVTEINPLVDENGHVTVVASIAGAGSLVDGMNARVRIRRSLGERLVVPKSAVVLRTGRQVVFTLDGKGRAAWNYVTTGLENLDSYEITDGLEAGADVIYDGNENLAHEAPVRVVDK